MYKIVNWLDDLRPLANVNVEDAPAHADYEWSDSDPKRLVPVLPMPLQCWGW